MDKPNEFDAINDELVIGDYAYFGSGKLDDGDLEHLIIDTGAVKVFVNNNMIRMGELAEKPTTVDVTPTVLRTRNHSIEGDRKTKIEISLAGLSDGEKVYLESEAFSAVDNVFMLCSSAFDRLVIYNGMRWVAKWSGAVGELWNVILSAEVVGVTSDKIHVFSGIPTWELPEDWELPVINGTIAMYDAMSSENDLLPADEDGLRFYREIRDLVGVRNITFFADSDRPVYFPDETIAKGAYCYQDSIKMVFPSAITAKTIVLAVCPASERTMRLLHRDANMGTGEVSALASGIEVNSGIKSDGIGQAQAMLISINNAVDGFMRINGVRQPISTPGSGNMISARAICSSSDAPTWELNGFYGTLMAAWFNEDDLSPADVWKAEKWMAAQDYGVQLLNEE